MPSTYKYKIINIKSYNMKKTFLFIAFLLSFCAYMPVYSQDCGTWEVDTVFCESWISIDTINYKPMADTAWTVTEWQYVMNPAHANLIYCPCGCGYDTWEIRKRVSAVGIIQQQKRITRYKYVESEFEKRLNELKKSHDNN